MLDRLIVENLKGFGPRQEVELAPLTLIYGPNAGGKSTLIQALLLLKQSVEAGDTVPPTLVTNGPLVNVGSFPAAVHRQELDQTMHIGVGFSDREDSLTSGPDPEKYPGYEWKLLMRKELITVDFAFSGKEGEAAGYQTGVTLGVGGRLPVCGFALEDEYRFRLANGAARAAWNAWIGRELQERADYEREDTWGEDRELFADFLRAEGSQGMGDLEPRFEITGHFPGAIDLHRRLNIREIDHDRWRYWRVIEKTWGTWATYYAGVLRKRLAEVAYLGPLRRAPERYHVISGDRGEGVGREGERTWQLLAQDTEFVETVNRWLERLQIPYTLAVGRARERAFGDLLLVQLTDRRNGTAVSPSDVGFGVSQVLPLVVAVAQLFTGTLCVEQPEVHLHPRLQAELADLFIERTRRDENYPTGQLLIETHSEALMLRIQRRIREGVLKPDDVSVLYVDPEGGTATTVKRLRLDRLGRFIDEWPGGFFEERLNETLLGFEN